MKTGPITALLLAAVLSLPAAAAPGKPDTATALAMKRTMERYAINKARISTLLDPRLNPTQLPPNLPNPFYRSPDLAATPGGRVGPPAIPGGTGDPTATPDTPVEPDVSDTGTLAKFVSTLKVSGLTILKGVSHLTLNGTLCKAGDTIPVDVKGHTVYIQVKAIAQDELTLRLNEDEQVVRLRK